MDCWVEWLIGCSAVGCQNSESLVVGCPNPSTWGSKYSKLGLKIVQVGSPNRPESIPGGILERSWGHVGPKIAPRPKTSRKVKFLSPCWGPSWSPTWHPKPSQNEAKLVLKSIQVEVLI